MDTKKHQIALLVLGFLILRATSYAILDEDGNGTSDIWEGMYGQNLPANVDSDGDGMLNSEEYARGTNPLVKDSSKESIAITGDGTGGYEVEFGFFAGEARDFQIYTIEDLKNPSWDAQELVTGHGGMFWMSELMNVQKKFYRIDP
ncbi:MAG: thrombospondin type 3 repeat-containing protein, partial [Verrucomicrobiota bacterium]